MAEHVVVRLSNSQVAVLAASQSFAATHTIDTVLKRADALYEWMKEKQEDG